VALVKKLSEGEYIVSFRQGCVTRFS
jgi:hypothetical protein